jgi:hypothetical protein
MMLVRDLLCDPQKSVLLSNLAIIIIPVYNIEGCLNRTSSSRVNQNGPELVGFRGNARNFDLNRDFIKCDTKNAQSFSKIFTKWRPDVLIDNHTSNGADYQYVMTLITTQHNKLPRPLADYLQARLIPSLYDGMFKKNFEMTPYVNINDGCIPDQGIYGFYDSPRYSSGYASLFQCLSFMPETHMLKPFDARVYSTYAFMEVMMRHIDRDHAALAAARALSEEETSSLTSLPLHWELDDTRWDDISFKGYEAGYKKSEVSGLDRLYYDREKPFIKPIKFFNYFLPKLIVDKPAAYIVPRVYESIVSRLLSNGVPILKLTSIPLSGLAIDVEQYYIENYKSRSKPYEGHYLHSEVEVRTLERSYNSEVGDYVIQLGSVTDRYVMETLEPQASDSFFCWNFFDSIFTQQENYSPYVFEDLAAAILRDNPDLQTALEAKRQSDPTFACSAAAQLDFVYRRSKWYESSHNAYPVLRVKSVSDGLLTCARSLI